LLACLVLWAPRAANAIDLSGYPMRTPADCDDLTRRFPDEPGAYYCYRRVARRIGGRAVLDHLARLPASKTGSPMMRFARATVEHDSSEPAAEAHLRAAADEFARRAVPVGEVHTRLELFFLLNNLGRSVEAGVELQKADDLAAASGSAALQAWVAINRAVQADSAGDLSRASAILKGAEPDVEKHGDPYLHRILVNNMAGVQFRLGQAAEALEGYRRTADMCRAANDAYMEASARHNMALSGSRLIAAGALSRESVRSMLQDALAVAVRAENKGVEAACLMSLGQDSGLTIAVRRGHVEKAIQLSRKAGRIENTLFATRLLANLQTHRGAAGEAESVRLLGEAIEGAREHGMGEQLARSYLMRASNYTYYGHRAEAIRDSAKGVEVVEKLRDLQADESVRARFFSQWAFFYERYAGLLLGLDERVRTPPTLEDLESGFQVLERIRSRALLDLLDGAGATDALAPAGPLRQRRAETLRAISTVQKDLLRPDLDDAGRKLKLEALDRLEADELIIRDELARQAPAFAAARQFMPVSISDVRGQLRSDQALIEYLIWDEGYSHPGALIVTRDGARVVVLRIPAGLQDRLAAYLGLVDRRDAAEPRAAARLAGELITPILAVLPDGIQELVISPYGDLHRVPFAALRTSEDQPPLAVRYQITLIPSAAVWLRCVRMATPPAVLAMAMPDASALQRGGERARNATSPLGALPHAPREARAMLRAFGGEGLVLEGGLASERYLKNSPLERFGLLHLAAHAIVDDLHPNRSSVMLAPGAPEEDGLLQIREIVMLPLQGKGILLSACSGASGAIIEGEGVVGLARAFFQAGARGVAGSLWPLRDDEAADLMEDLAAGLGRGLSIGSALTMAQRERASAGMPAAAWAGMVVLGDGGLTPLPGAPDRRPSPPSTLWPFVILAGVAALAWASRHAPA